LVELSFAAASVGGVLRDATARLFAAGCDTPRLDAELLLASVLGTERSRLVIDARAPVGAAELARFEALVARRVAREPVAYIVGFKAFRRLVLRVDRRVLVPRPETELLVEVGLTLEAGSRVIDVGTGSGAVALALKDERPDLSVWGSDVDAGALAVARANGSHLGVGVEFVQADLLDGMPGLFDAVLANLPYVRVGAELPLEVERYEPAEALFAGVDGLDVIRRLVDAVASAPRASLVALEVGFDQAAAVAGLFEAAGFRSVERLRDLAGHERVVVARR
jgi:release factor glutamine methyltransferase